MGRPAPIRFLCVGDDHLRVGASVPDEHGYFTIHDDQWAYCSAARPVERHVWEEIPATHVFALRHEALLRRFGSGVGDYGAAAVLIS